MAAPKPCTPQHCAFIKRFAIITRVGTRRTLVHGTGVGSYLQEDRRQETEYGKDKRYKFEIYNLKFEIRGNGVSF